MTSAAERQRRYRQRQRDRKRVARIAISGEWIDTLIESGWLEEKAADDWAAVEVATSNVLNFLAEREFSVTRNARLLREALLLGMR